LYVNGLKACKYPNS